MATNVVPTGWSSDHNWFWDGTKWNDAVSADGRWRFDGTTWQPFAGQRSPMPAPAPAQPPPPSAAPAQAAAPSWLAASEIERMQKEAADRERAVAAAAAEATQQAEPMPHELDWRQVGRNLERTQPGRQYADWQIGTTSVVIWALLYLFCTWGSLVFIFFTGWKTSSKVLVAVLSFAAPIGLAFALFAAGVLPARATP